MVYQVEDQSCAVLHIQICEEEKGQILEPRQHALLSIDSTDHYIHVQTDSIHLDPPKGSLQTNDQDAPIFQFRFRVGICMYQDQTRHARESKQTIRNKIQGSRSHQLGETKMLSNNQLWNVGQIHTATKTANINCMHESRNI